MSHYKLTYFNGRGRAEISRLVFAAAGVEYEDVRIQREDWAALKPTAPFGQLPMLEVDGVKLAQSNAMARFLARRFGLAGKTDLDQVRADMIIDCFEDTTKPLITLHFEKDEAKKAELHKKYIEEQLPASLDNLEKLLTQNNGGDGFFVGDSLTWADLGLLIFATYMKLAKATELFEKRKKLYALSQRVENLPKIAAWLAKRPETEF
jgi:glutathione S-transferase